MSAWIFQGNPDKFDLDAYLDLTHEIVWTVKQKGEDMRQGDKVFLWRASGKAKAISGVIAVGHLSGEPQESEEDEASRGLWREAEGGKVALRVPVTLSEVDIEYPLKRERLKRDPILRKMRILNFANETNYLLQPHEEKRLSRLWDNHVRGGETPLLTDEVRVGEWNAHFSLGEDDKGKFVIFHSRGGDITPSGEKRNHQYADGLETILCRLAKLNGSVTDALVDSGPARKLEEKERRLRLEDSDFTYPIRLGGIGKVKDHFKVLRLAMGKAQIPVGQANPGPNPKGNSTKKIRIYIDTADDVGLDEIERVLGRREGRSDVPQESDQDEVAQVSNLWTRESTELFRREIRLLSNELLDLLAKSPERRFQALELVELLGLNNHRVLKGILSNLTRAAKRAGISQELEGSWFVSWTNHPNHPMEYWLSQERAEWWSGRKSTKAQESESAGEDTGHSVSSHSDAPDDDLTPTRRGDWSYAEIFAAVGAYLRVRTAEGSGHPLVKAEVSRELRESALRGRTRGSVSFRMQNISAVMSDLGIQWVQGYKPAVNVGPGPSDMIRRALREHGTVAEEVASVTADEEVLAERVAMMKGTDASPPDGNLNPRRIEGSSTSYERSPRVVRFVLDAADGSCEMCGAPAPFLRTDGEPFLEVHHVIPLGEGGRDTVENAVAVCPNCHRECHHGNRAGEIPSQLRGKVSRLAD